MGSIARSFERAGIETRREATAAPLARDTELAKAEAEAKGGLDAGNLISLLGLQQQADQHNESLGLRRNQFVLNQEQADNQRVASERNATAKYIDLLNSEDPGIAASALAQLHQVFLQNPDSPEGRLLLSQAARALRRNSGDERGPIDGLISVLPEGLGGKDGQPQFPGTYAR